MLAVGRALMSRPDMLMLDEPSLGLAPLLVREIFNIVRRINEQGMTVLLVEQNAYAALNVAHYAYILEVGRVVLEGTGQELLENPKSKRPTSAASFVAAVYSLFIWGEGEPPALLSMPVRLLRRLTGTALRAARWVAR